MLTFGILYDKCLPPRFKSKFYIKWLYARPTLLYRAKFIIGQELTCLDKISKHSRNDRIKNKDI